MRILYHHRTASKDGQAVHIEEMIAAALDAGALGAKINGSGGGGCMFAYAPSNPEKVAAAVAAAGGRPFVVRVDEGVRRDDRKGTKE